MKDYGLKGSETDYLNKIIDKEILAGVVERTERTGSETKDDLINGLSGNTEDDTGLYELYANVVRLFIEAMIAEAERYAGISGSLLPTDNWVARTEQGSANTTNPHGSGMSYCFGCKDLVEDFNRTVANCQAETTTAITNRETDNISGNEYRGNINNTTCAIGSGSTDWVGLRLSEYSMWAQGLSTGIPFNPAYWAGIDCSGFVQRSVENGRDVASGLNITIPSPLNWINSQAFFTDNTRVLYMQNPPSKAARVRLQKKIRKGDIVRYSGHISIVYSGRPICGATTCTYEIIHASGNNKVCYEQEDNNLPDQCFFNRKVVKNEINDKLTSKTLKNPTGFGRIKLWD